MSKVTIDPKCFAIFYHDFCVFQYLFDGKVKEIGRENDGLYVLQNHGTKKITAVSLAVVGAKSKSTTTTTDVALWQCLVTCLLLSFDNYFLSN